MHKTPTLLLLLATACGQQSAPAPIPTSLPAHRPPADRIDPVQAQSMTNAEFQALGEARSGPRPFSSLAGARFVAPDGDDTADGSEQTPWRTIQYAADQAEPGMTIVVRGEHRGTLSIYRSGTSEAPIVFQGDGAVIRGATEDSAVDIDASYVTFRGFEIAEVQNSALTDTIGIQIEPRNGDITNVEVSENVIHHVGPGPLDQTTCGYDGHGIIAQSEGHRITNLVIRANELHDLYVGSSECLVVNGNVDGFRIIDNYIHDVNNIAIDVIGYEKNRTETAKNGLIADNVILDASNYWPYCSRGNCTYPAGDESSDGIYVDGGADTIIEHNVVIRTDHGIELQSENNELIRNVEVRFNLVLNSNYKNFTLGDSENCTEHDNVFTSRADLADATFEACR